MPVKNRRRRPELCLPTQDARPKGTIMNSRIEQFSGPHNGENSFAAPGVPGNPSLNALQNQAAKAMQWVRAYPAASVGAALFLGVLVGWFIKRR